MAIGVIGSTHVEGIGWYLIGIAMFAAYGMLRRNHIPVGGYVLLILALAVNAGSWALNAIDQPGILDSLPTGA